LLVGGPVATAVVSIGGNSTAHPVAMNVAAITKQGLKSIVSSFEGGR
jgi:hypothetical protein